ncbi:hypothetical protein Poli38472_003875 [Pythium oligandrum]|uniref:C2 domain-containing protein n=1 Tax=Pythium oligandrum TaxID=41045 RepID=A0A8K1CP03_PYTOL|nr:hypothetical protein Poli38472_003875 [Pythium oligandrum]|eukprot:TMW66110.1 hypothetical protein Poli38472_003875 [Pythium oligandrum]
MEVTPDSLSDNSIDSAENTTASTTEMTMMAPPPAPLLRADSSFERAKNFWETREALVAQNSQDQLVVEDEDETNDRSGAISPPPSSSVSTASSATPGRVRPMVEPASPPGSPRSPPGSPPGSPPPSPSSSPSPPKNAESAQTSSPPKSGITNVFKSKFFGGNSDKAGDQVSMPSVPVQLPDMSSWKEKMRSYRSRSQPHVAKASMTFEKLSTQLKTSLSQATSSTTEGERQVSAAARNNIHRPSHRTGSSASSSPVSDVGSPHASNPFGELVVVEILAAKELAVGDFFQGESDPYVNVKFQDWERKTSIVKGTKNPVFNERFVYWVADTEATNEQLISLVVMNKNLVMTDESLGQVHLSLKFPLNEAFDEWYPLVKDNGEQRGYIRIGLRRMVLQSSELQQAAQSLATPDRPLNEEDLVTYGSVIPDLWYGFAEAAEPIDTTTISQTDVLATKLNGLSRRLMGIEIASTEVTPEGQRRNIF